MLVTGPGGVRFIQKNDGRKDKERLEVSMK